ncbi:replication factor C subunit 1 [Physcia stellaris]|nr:replication factor C subunit 1 [Physcia stellaris]
MGGQFPGSDYTRCAESRTVESETQVDAVDEQQEQAKAERGEKTAENVRYGQNISEGGMGGMTTDSQGGGNQEGGFGGTEDQTGTGSDREAAETRQQQDYGSGSGVGA